jgi:ribosomal protein L32
MELEWGHERLAVGYDVIEQVIETVVCEGCGSALRPGVVVCCQCGYHRGLKQQVETTKGVADPPPRTLPPVGKQQWLRNYSKQVVRQEYLKPLVMFAVGTAIMLPVMLFQGGLALGGAYLLSFPVSVAIGLAVLWACSALWIGFDAPLMLTALRLTGIYAVTDVALVAGLWLLSGVPVPFIGFLPGAVVYVALLADVLDLDLVDAIAVAVFTFVAKCLLVLVGLSWLIGLIVG